MNSLTGKIALVTGGSQGIGKAIVLGLVHRGATVIVNDVRSSAELANYVVQEAESMGGNAVAFSADVSNKSELIALRDFVKRKHGKLDILVNNAGVIMRPADWINLSEENITRTLDINLKGVIFAIQVFAPLMIEQRFGRVVNISSIYGLTGAAPVLAYSASKAAVANITFAMARELGKHGITVNAVAPGHIDTAMTRSAGEEFIRWAESTTPLGRLGKPEEIADAVLFLISTEFVNGHVLVVDGGHGGHLTL